MRSTTRLSWRTASAVVLVLLCSTPFVLGSDFLDDPTDDVESELFPDEPDDMEAEMDAAPQDVHADAGRHVPRQPSTTTEPDTEFLDTDEFDGIEEYKQKVASQQQQQQQQQKQPGSSPGAPSSSTGAVSTEPKTYFYEFLASVFMLAYLVTFWMGKQKNKQIADNWITQCYTLFESQFAVLGAYHGSEQTKPLVEDSANQFRFYASGRRGCSGALATLNLVSRHDLFGLILSWLDLGRNKDEMTLEIPMDSDEMEAFVFAIAPRRDVKRLLKDEADLRDFAEAVACDRLVADLCLLTDIPDLQTVLLDPKVTRTLKHHADLVKLVHFTDQSENKFSPPTTKMLTYKFTIPSSEEDVARLVELIEMALYLVDVVSDVQLSVANRARSEKKRLAMREQKLKAERTARQEEALRKREERREKEDGKLSKEALRKKEAKEERERLKRLRPKVKMLKS